MRPNKLGARYTHMSLPDPSNMDLAGRANSREEVWSIKYQQLPHNAWHNIFVEGDQATACDEAQQACCASLRQESTPAGLRVKTHAGTVVKGSTLWDVT